MELDREPIIKIRDLYMNFGDKEVLKGINLDVYKGQIIGYIGPNGAGKSTTVKIMLGLIEGYTGNIEIFGESIEKGAIEYKRRIGYVPETADIYDSLTANEYLTFIGELYGMTSDEVDNKAKRLMNIFDIENAYNSRISSYSKGMRQKVAIISSLIHNPDVLFLDEPLSGLDANTVIIVKEILSKLASKGKTIFYSSHIMEVVEKISSRIVLLNDGQIVADGSFEDLKNTCSEGSLEQIFNQLTGFNEHENKAEEFVTIIEEGERYE
ncbi:ABC transporter ATP-binding protein [Clostridium sp. MSJ-11]|uniref:ABC transporter ATP-binding protein n=1 Tax=Clostridium mobile TaxID=2841512 RepID=A0ABS6EFK1_9CLOT|nr:ABC transporter ATP-binding protein [Clostridium mobile]MBU5483992.1 ABC transporter ATP-binding protein [Clostridium mobile]